MCQLLPLATRPGPGPWLRDHGACGSAAQEDGARILLSATLRQLPGAAGAVPGVQGRGGWSPRVQAVPPAAKCPGCFRPARPTQAELGFQGRRTSSLA